MTLFTHLERLLDSLRPMLGIEVESADGCLPHMGDFGEVVDSIRVATKRAIPYKSQEWSLLYIAYLSGRTDATREETAPIGGEIQG